jgi:hypothetical protein
VLDTALGCSKGWSIITAIDDNYWQAPSRSDSGAPTIPVNRRFSANQVHTGYNSVILSLSDYTTKAGVA